MGGQVRIEREGAVGWVVFDHPERRNAISVEMWRSLPRVAAELDADPEVRVVVLRGAGDVAFVSGADISEFERTRTPETSADYDVLNARAFGALLSLDKPLLAMIHGFCVGGGAAIALTADVRYAADDAQFGIPAARLGIGYAPGGIERLIDVVGRASAAEILFTARRFSADEALRMGLVNAVYAKADLEDCVRKTARTIAANAPLSLRSSKLALRELAKPAGQRDDAGMLAAVRTCMTSEDYREGTRAFLEKRPPVFRGR